MPFFDDSGVRHEDHRGPLLSAFAMLLDQIERMVALNLVWSLNLVPALVAWFLPELPLWVRILLFAYTAVAIGPATALVYAMLKQACESDLLSIVMARETFRLIFRSSLFTLVPLYSSFIWLALLASWASQAQLVIIDTIVRLGFLLLTVFGLFWGPLFADRPELSAAGILKESIRLAWRFPLLTMLTWLACLLALVIGILSIGGLFLIIPVLLALISTQLYRHLLRRSVLV
jgi:uncharacterized membrane protein